MIALTTKTGGFCLANRPPSSFLEYFLRQDPGPPYLSAMSGSCIRRMSLPVCFATFMNAFLNSSQGTGLPLMLGSAFPFTGNPYFCHNERSVASFVFLCLAPNKAHLYNAAAFLGSFRLVFLWSICLL